MKTLPLLALALPLALAAGVATAKLPAPSDEAKAKAAEAAAKAAHAGKVDAYRLCKVQDKVAADYLARARKAGSAAGAVVTTGACADPGPMVAAAAAPAPKK